MDDSVDFCRDGINWLLCMEYITQTSFSQKRLFIMEGGWKYEVANSCLRRKQRADLSSN